jgi:hypothetical protein
VQVSGIALKTAAGVDPELVSGERVNLQYWSRDPGAVSTPT